MTTIVGKVNESEIILAADSKAVWGNFQYECSKNNPKIHKVNENFGFGIAGIVLESNLFLAYVKQKPLKSFIYSGILSYLAKFQEWKEEHVPEALKEEMDSEYLIYCGGILYTYTLTNGFYEVDDYWVIGSGSCYATTALYLGFDYDRSIKVAENFDTYTGGEIKVLRFKK